MKNEIKKTIEIATVIASIYSVFFGTGIILMVAVAVKSILALSQYEPAQTAEFFANIGVAVIAIAVAIIAPQFLLGAIVAEKVFCNK